MAREDEVRLIAYRIWEEEGCPDGRDCEHWFIAETVWEEQQEKAASPKKKTQTKPVARKTGKAVSKKNQK